MVRKVVGDSGLQGQRPLCLLGLGDVADIALDDFLAVHEIDIADEFHINTLSGDGYQRRSS